MSSSRFITVAIHTYEHAVKLKKLLENEGIEVCLNNVNLDAPVVAAGIRVRIHENDLPLALRIIENPDIFGTHDNEVLDKAHSVLVPIDFSEYSFRAVTLAFYVAKLHNAEIVLLHSYIDPANGANMQLANTLTFDLVTDSEVRRQVEMTAETQMQNFVRKVKELIRDGEIPPVKFTTRIVEGVPEDVIDEYSKVNNPYILVMGTRGAKRKSDEMIGSVTAEVIDKCRTTVLSVPETFVPKTKMPMKVLFVINLVQEDILAIDTFSRIFKDTDATVTVVPMPERKRFLSDRSTEPHMARLMEYFKHNYPTIKFETTSFVPDHNFSNLQELTKQLDTDLIVIPNRKRLNALARMITPALPRKLLMSIDLPMLVIRV